VLGFVLSPIELKFEAVELFTVNAVQTIKPLLSCSHVTLFSVRGLPRTYSLNLRLFNLSAVILTSEMVTYNLVVAAMQNHYGYFKDTIIFFETNPVDKRSTLHT